MPDVHDKATRSRNMAAIKGKNTKPELMIRSGLHRKGFRYRIHDKSLPGKPDLVFPKYNAVIFVQGCFWHQHNCHLFKWPKSNQLFWQKKIAGNLKREQENYTLLHTNGWRIGIVWECALKGKTRKSEKDFLCEIAKWLKSKNKVLEIEGAITCRAP